MMFKVFSLFFVVSRLLVESETCKLEIQCRKLNKAVALKDLEINTGTVWYNQRLMNTPKGYEQACTTTEFVHSQDNSTLILSVNYFIPSTKKLSLNIYELTVIDSNTFHIQYFQDTSITLIAQFAKSKDMIIESFCLRKDEELQFQGYIAWTPEKHLQNLTVIDDVMKELNVDVKNKFDVDQNDNCFKPAIKFV